LLVSDSNRQYFVYAGDYMFFFHSKIHINLAAINYMMTGISILTLNFVRYYIDQKPEFLECYDFLSGKVTPARAGLRNGKSILILVLKSKALLNITNFNTSLVFVVSFVLSILPLISNLTSSEVILFGLPWSLVFAIASFYTFSWYSWNMVY